MADVKAIFIDAGHGLGTNDAVDNGAAANGTTERKETVEIASECIDDILRQKWGIPVYPIGVSERLSLAGKVKVVNDICREKGFTASNALLVSVHINAGGGTGIEGWYEGGNTASKTFAENVGKAVAAEVNLKYRKTAPDTSNNHGRLAIVRDVLPTAMLCECAFIDTPTDVGLLLDPVKDGGFARGIVKGIAKQLGKTYIEPDAEIDNPSGFIDVPEGMWFTEAVKKVAKAGYMTGDNGRFYPAKAVSRAELAEILRRALKL